MDMRAKDIEKLSGKVEGLSRIHDSDVRENNCRKVDARLDMAYRGISVAAANRGVSCLRVTAPWR